MSDTLGLKKFEIKKFNSIIKSLDQTKYSRGCVFGVLIAEDPYSTFEKLPLENIYDIYVDMEKDLTPHVSLDVNCRFKSATTFLVWIMLQKLSNKESATDRVKGQIIHAISAESQDILPILETLDDKNTFLADLDYHLAAPLLAEMVSSDAQEIINSFQSTYDYHQLFMEMCSRHNDIPRAAAIIADVPSDIQQKIFVYDNDTWFTYASIIKNMNFQKAVNLFTNTYDSSLWAEIIILIDRKMAREIIYYLKDALAAGILEKLDKEQQKWFLESVGMGKAESILNHYKDVSIASEIYQ